MVQTIFVFAAVILLFSISSKINPFSAALNGVQYGFNAIGTGIRLSYDYVFKSRAELQQNLDHYQDLVATLAEDKAQLSELQQNLDELELLLNYKQTINYKTIVARVISRSVDNKNYLLIDKGVNDGLQEGMAVVIENGHLIGTIFEIKENSSIVLLLSNSESKVPAAILGSNKTIGLVEGQNGFLLAMNYIPQNEKIFEGDVVISSGLDGSVPSGLIIGVVSTVIVDETNPFQQALIEPIYDAGLHNNVLIIDHFEHD